MKKFVLAIIMLLGVSSYAYAAKDIYDAPAFTGSPETTDKILGVDISASGGSRLRGMTFSDLLTYLASSGFLTSIASTDLPTTGSWDMSSMTITFGLESGDIPDLSGTYLTAEVDGSTTNEIEVVDETFSAANFNGGISSAVSQDDFYDRFHLFDTDDDGDFTDETWFSSSDNQTAAEVPFTPAGDIAATNTQAAIQELDTEKLGAADGTSASTIGQSLVTAADLAAARLAMGFVVSDDCSGETPTSGVICFEY